MGASMPRVSSLWVEGATVSFGLQPASQKLNVQRTMLVRKLRVVSFVVFITVAGPERSRIRCFPWSLVVFVACFVAPGLNGQNPAQRSKLVEGTLKRSFLRRARGQDPFRSRRAVLSIVGSNDVPFDYKCRVLEDVLTRTDKERFPGHKARNAMICKYLCTR